MTNQVEHESVADFVIHLQQLDCTCLFGGFLHEALRDRLVSRLHQKMATTETDSLSKEILSFEDARVKCLLDELSGKANKEHMASQTARTEDGAMTQLQRGEEVDAIKTSSESAILCAGREKGGSVILRTVGTYLQVLWIVGTSVQVLWRKSLP